MEKLSHLANLIRSFPDHGDWEVSHDLFFARGAEAGRAASEARALGCAVEVHAPHDADVGEWLVILRYPALPGPDTVNPIARALRTVAARHGGEYGGWSGGHRRAAA